MDGSPGNTLSPEEQIEVNKHAKGKAAHHRSVQFTREVGENKVPPDLQFQFRLAAVACGLGEIGWSKMLLTPEFGPLQRVAFIFTDAELEYDEMYSGKPLCRRCGACVRECPGGCIPPIKDGAKVTVDLDGKICEWGDIDMWRCYAFYTHGGRYFNPFVPKEVFDKNENGMLDLFGGRNRRCKRKRGYESLHSARKKYFPSWVGNNMAKMRRLYKSVRVCSGEKGRLYGKPFQSTAPHKKSVENGQIGGRKMNAEYIKKKAKELGASVCGIGDVSLFKGDNPQHNPYSILPNAKCIIGFGLKIPRGLYDTMERKTQYYNYTNLGVKIY
ncbi:MAG: hypothetical protein L6V93_22060 [Clostridiales bacterium]|nr:MAG: hypothetical protein L6V93_22060 [Clostridiales bacterium]